MQADQKITLEMTAAQCQVIRLALYKAPLPFEISGPVIQLVDQQAMAHERGNGAVPFEASHVSD